MLVNTWASIIVVKLTGDFFSSWEDYFWLFVLSIISPIPVLIIRWVNTIRQKIKKGLDKSPFICYNKDTKKERK